MGILSANAPSLVSFFKKMTARASVTGYATPLQLGELAQELPVGDYEYSAYLTLKSSTTTSGFNLSIGNSLPSGYQNLSATVQSTTGSTVATTHQLGGTMSQINALTSPSGSFTVKICGIINNGQVTRTIVPIITAETATGVITVESGAVVIRRIA